MSRTYSGDGAARIVAVIADTAALILGVWILLYLMDANQGNDLVGWVHHTANWLSGWSHDIFTPDEGWLRVLLNYGVAALAYLFLGHLAAGRIRRI